MCSELCFLSPSVICKNTEEDRVDSPTGIMMGADCSLIQSAKSWVNATGLKSLKVSTSKIEHMGLMLDFFSQTWQSLKQLSDNALKLVRAYFEQPSSSTTRPKDRFDFAAIVLSDNWIDE